MNRVSAVLLFCLCLLFPASGHGTSQVDPILKDALLRVKPAAYLDVTMSQGNRFIGEFCGVNGDSLLLRRLSAEGTFLKFKPLALADIIRIRHQGSGASRGFGTGFTTGAVVGGSLSLLWSIALDSLDGKGGNVGAIAALTSLGALTGGLGLGTIGAGIGAMTHTWYTDYEAPLAPPPSPEQYASNTRVALGFGVGTGYEDEEDFETTGLYAQAGLQKPLGKKLEFGPEIGYYDLDGTIRHDEPLYTSIESTSPIITIGLVGTIQSQRPGWSPYLVFGTGYYLGGGEYLGASFGGGVKLRSEKLQDFKLEIRDHINLHDDDHSFHLDYFITVGANFSFAL